MGSQKESDTTERPKHQQTTSVLSLHSRPRSSTWNRQCPAPRGPWRADPPKRPRESGGRRSSGPERSGPSCGGWRTTSTRYTSGGDKRSGNDTAPRPGGSCTISSWDSCPSPGAAEPPRWSPIRCLYPPGGCRGPGGAGPSQLLTPWPARGTLSAPCSILDYSPARPRGGPGQPLPTQPRPSPGEH